MQKGFIEFVNSQDADFICLEPWAQTPVYDGGTEELTRMANANIKTITLMIMSISFPEIL